MNSVTSKNTLTDRTTVAIRDVLAGKRRGLPSALLFAGPAVIASIAATVVILVLNAVLLLQTFGVSIPGMPAS